MWNEYIKYISEQLFPVLVSLAILDGANLTNMIGGLIMAWSVKQEDWNRFYQSVLKWLLINLFVLCACLVCSSITYVVGLGNFLSQEYYKIAEGIITVGEILGIIWITLGKYLKEIWNKMKILFDITNKEEEKIQTTFEKFREFQDSEEGIG